MCFCRLLLLLEEVADAFFQYLGAEEPEDGEVDDGGKGDAGEEEQGGGAEREEGTGGEPGQDHGGGGGEEEGHDVLQGGEEGVADFLVEEAVPDGGPEDDDEDVGDDHEVEALERQVEGGEGDVQPAGEGGVDHEDAAEDGASLGDDVPHIDVGLAARDDEVVVEGGDGQEGAADAEDLHELGGGEPLFFNQCHDELWCHQRQSEHDGEGDEGGEAEHLGEDAAEASEVVAHLDEGGLRHALHHAGDGGRAHGVPLVGLGVGAHLDFGVDLAEHEGEDVVVDLVEDACDEHLGGEGEHLPDGTSPRAGRFFPFGQRESGSPS